MEPFPINMTGKMFYDWLMYMKQKSDEKIRPFSLKLPLATRKCGIKGDMLDNAF